MKKFFVCSLAFVVALTSTGIAANTTPLSKSIKVTAPVYSIAIQGNLEVVLVHDASLQVTIEGAADDINAIAVQNDNNRLSLTVVKRKLKGKVVIHVPMQQVSDLSLYGDVRLRTNDVIASEALRVFVDGDCTASLKTTGIINVQHSDDCEITYFNNSGKGE